jgi:hypothetical protein
MNNGDGETMRALVEGLREMKLQSGVNKNEIQEEDLRQEAKKWFEESRQQAEMIAAVFRLLERAEGTFYLPIEKAWGISMKQCSPHHFNNFKRKKCQISPSGGIRQAVTLRRTGTSRRAKKWA